MQELINQLIFILHLVLEHGIPGPELGVLSHKLVELGLFEIELVLDILFLVEAVVLVAAAL